MPAKRKRIYWDACTFIHYMEGTPEWEATLAGILEEVASGKAIIVTSTLSIAEAGFAAIERDNLPLDPTAVANLDRLWADENMVVIVDVDPTLAFQARELVRRGQNEGRSLSGADAIHLATAHRENVDHFHTLDMKLRAWNSEALPITPPEVQQLGLTLASGTGLEGS